MDQAPRLRLVATGGELTGYLARVYEQFKELAAASRHKDRIHALGWLPMEQANRWLAAAELGVVVDRPCAETRLGARNRLLYDAAARCPVVATRGTEVVAEMETAGALAAVPTGDAAALGRAIAELLNQSEKSRALAERSYTFCEQHYLFSRTSGPWLDFIVRPVRTGLNGAGEAADSPTRSAAHWIAHRMDLATRHTQPNEPESPPSSPLARLKRWFFG